MSCFVLYIANDRAVLNEQGVSSLRSDKSANVHELLGAVNGYTSVYPTICNVEILTCVRGRGLKITDEQARLCNDAASAVVNVNINVGEAVADGCRL